MILQGILELEGSLEIFCIEIKMVDFYIFCIDQLLVVVRKGMSLDEGKF